MRRRRARPPVAVTVLSALAVGFLVLPFVALLQRAPWSDLGSVLGGEVATDALRISLLTSAAAAALSVLLGVPLAWLLARRDFPGRSLVRGLVTLPMVLPPVVGGAALLFALGRRGLIGEPLHDATGLVLPYSTWGVVVAGTFVALPFLVVTVEAGLRALDPRHEEVAETLGARPSKVLRHVTLPLALPSIGAGTVLAWARALGEFGATVTFAGNLQGRTQTVPLAVFLALETDRDAAIALSLVLVAVSLAVIVPLRGRWR